jgi:glucose-6-phosphate isomerase
VTATAQLPEAARAAIDARLQRAAEEDVVGRIWAMDDTVWGPAGQAEVADRLGWLTIAGRMRDALPELDAFASDVVADGLRDVVLLGMGGSSLAPEVLWRTNGRRDGHLRLHLLDSTDAAAVAAVQAAVDLDETLFLVSTKSGGTIETLSAFAHFWALKPDGRHFAAITDPGSSLVDLAAQHGFRRTFLNDPDIGGRYSALSYFGLVPAALIGADVAALLERAEAAAKSCDAALAGKDNAGLWLGAALGELARAGRDKLTFVVDEAFASFGLWAEQLVAESTGKHGRGILPVADEPLGGVGDYGDDRVFLHVDTGAGGAPGLEALADAGHPVITLAADDDPAELGTLFFVLEFATAVAGWVLEINPFDQPNVQEAKDNTKRVLEEGVPDIEPASDEELRALLDAGPPHSVAIMAYVAPDPAVDAAAADLRAAIRARRRATTTFGYGPRFLHSTGQLHKGGAPTGRFLQLVTDVVADVEVPDQPYTFEVLKQAQAAGDLQTLRGHDLPAQRVVLHGDDPAAAVRDLTARIEGLED